MISMADLVAGLQAFLDKRKAEIVVEKAEQDKRIEAARILNERIGKDHWVKLRRLETQAKGAENMLRILKDD